MYTNTYYRYMYLYGLIFCMLSPIIKQELGMVIQKKCLASYETVIWPKLLIRLIVAFNPNLRVRPGPLIIINKSFRIL